MSPSREVARPETQAHLCETPDPGFLLVNYAASYNQKDRARHLQNFKERVDHVRDWRQRKFQDQDQHTYVH